MQNSFYSQKELISLGFKSIGQNILISRFARFYNTQCIELGDNVRIDDFCLLSGNICIGNNIHISAFSALYGGGEILIDDYSGLSPRCTLLSASDDFSGDYLVGPHYSNQLTNVNKGIIKINKFCQLGANSLVLPDVEIGEGSVTGAMTLVNKTIDSWGIYAGIPARLIKIRSKELLKFINE
jgi:acetyltransferase-like isoleucine patch superfamily enzyme